LPDESHSQERRLAAILCADVVGYSRMMAGDEAGTVGALRECRELIAGEVSGHRGRIFGTAGDGIIAEFHSAVDAVHCAVGIQQGLAERSARAKQPMSLRIGINLGDVLIEGDDLLGDGVNVAARLESLAEPGGICVSGSVHEQVRDRLKLDYEDLGEQRVKNLPRSVRAYRVNIEGQRAGQRGVKPRLGPVPKATTVAAALLLLIAVGTYLTWPRPLGFVLDIHSVLTVRKNIPLTLPRGPSIAVLAF
jgi:class 3 adenylate cyclase